MIDALKRKLGIIDQAPVKTETNKDENMDKQELSSGVDESVVAGLQASVAALTTQLASAVSKIAELNSVIDASKQLEADKEAAAQAAKLADRKDQVTAAVGSANAEAVMSALAGLDDGSFATVLSAMATSSKAEAQTKLFTEQGVDAAADLAKTTAESNATMTYLKSKYQSAK